MRNSRATRRPNRPRRSSMMSRRNGHGLLGVVDVARAVLQPEDVAGLGHVGDQRVVARVFPMMGVEAAEGPADGGPGPDDRAIDVDRQARQVQAGERLGHEVAVEGDERGERLLRELAQPVRHGAAGGQPGQAAEARDQRIAAEVARGAPGVGPRHRTARAAPGRSGDCRSHCAVPRTPGATARPGRSGADSARAAPGRRTT